MFVGQGIAVVISEITELVESTCVDKALPVEAHRLPELTRHKFRISFDYRCYGLASLRHGHLALQIAIQRIISNESARERPIDRGGLRESFFPRPFRLFGMQL